MLGKMRQNVRKLCSLQAYGCEWLAASSNLLCQMEMRLEIEHANEQISATDFCQRLATQLEKSYQ